MIKEAEDTKEKELHGLEKQRTIGHLLSVWKAGKLSNSAAIYLMEMEKLLIIF